MGYALCMSSSCICQCSVAKLCMSWFGGQAPGRADAPFSPETADGASLGASVQPVVVPSSVLTPAWQDERLRYHPPLHTVILGHTMTVLQAQQYAG